MYKFFVPKGSIACLKLCMHRTIFWGGGIHLESSTVQSMWVWNGYIQTIIEATYNKNTDLLQAHYEALAWRITFPRLILHVYFNWHKITYNTHLTNRMIFLASFFFVYVVTMEWIKWTGSEEMNELTPQET